MGKTLSNPEEEFELELRELPKKWAELGIDPDDFLRCSVCHLIMAFACLRGRRSRNYLQVRRVELVRTGWIQIEVAVRSLPSRETLPTAREVADFIQSKLANTETDDGWTLGIVKELPAQGFILERPETRRRGKR